VITAPDIFDVAAKTDDGIVEGFRRTGRSALYDRTGVSLVLHCLYHGREAAARQLVVAGHRAGIHECAALGTTAELAGALEGASWSVDLLSPDGWTALHLAAFFGRLEAAGLLIAHGADADLWSRSFERNLAIHAAAAGRSRDVALLDLLLDATTDIDAIQDEGYSALLIAAAAGKQAWVEALQKAGADVGRRAKDGKGIADLMPGN
jgi:ankyrin repeat protein